VTLQYAVALNDRTSSNSSYRFYNDDWEISSHTISSELYYEINDEWLLGAGLRYYTQSEAEFYSNTFFSDEKYASSDERMRSFDAMGYKLNADYKVSETLHVNMGLNFYDQLDSFYATYYNIGLKYKF
jgi:long-subunit fatty acid transport protein